MPHCYQCGAAITRQSVDQILQDVRSLPEGERAMILAPIVRGRKGEFKKELAKLAAVAQERRVESVILVHLDGGHEAGALAAIELRARTASRAPMSDEGT